MPTTDVINSNCFNAIYQLHSAPRAVDGQWHGRRTHGYQVATASVGGNTITDKASWPKRGKQMHASTPVSLVLHHKTAPYSSLLRYVEIH